MRVLITGGNGMLACSLSEIFKDSSAMLVLSKSELDITNLNHFLEKVNFFKPDLILNTAAYTHVDDNELFPDLSLQVNALGARNAAVAARQENARLVHFSTDFVFDGRKQGPYKEWDTPNPLSVYGKSKLIGEDLIRQIHGMHYIVRTSWLFGEHGSNFVRTVCTRLLNNEKLRVVNDQRGSPTYSKDLARAVKILVETPAYGTYHLSNSSFCTRYELALEIAHFNDFRDNAIMPTTSKELNLPAIRPANSALDNCHWRLMGFTPLRDYRPALIEYLQALSLK